MDYTFDKDKRKVTIRFPTGEVSYWGLKVGTIVQYPTKVREDVAEELEKLGLCSEGDLEIKDYLEKL